MAVAELNRQGVEVNDDLHSIVIVKDLADLPGGITLNVSDVPSGMKVVKSGHILIQNESNRKDIKPLGVSGDAYVDLPQGWAYRGVLKHSVLVSDPRAAVLTQGQVNAAASPYPVTSAIRQGLPLIEFLY